jgi:hypothetical protein
VSMTEANRGLAVRRARLLRPIRPGDNGLDAPPPVRGRDRDPDATSDRRPVR